MWHHPFWSCCCCTNKWPHMTSVFRVEGRKKTKLTKLKIYYSHYLQIGECNLGRLIKSKRAEEEGGFGYLSPFPNNSLATDTFGRCTSGPFPLLFGLRSVGAEKGFKWPTRKCIIILCCSWRWEGRGPKLCISALMASWIIDKRPSLHPASSFLPICLPLSPS